MELVISSDVVTIINFAIIIIIIIIIMIIIIIINIIIISSIGNVNNSFDDADNMCVYVCVCVRVLFIMVWRIMR